MNRSRWDHLWEDCHAMDWRHVRMIHAVLMGERPPSVVEIGCYRGFSTAAIIEAIEAGAVGGAHLVDKELSRELLDAIKPVIERISLHECKSADFAGNGDCWIIDGDHGDPAHGDYAMARKGGARAIIIHDSISPEYREGHHGAIAISNKLRTEAVTYFEDTKKRPGERTDRGLLIGFFYQPKAETLAALMGIAEE